MLFSEREGYSRPKLALDEHQISESLRSKCWNCIFKIYFNDISVRSFDGYGRARYSERFDLISNRLRYGFFEITVDDKPDPQRERERIRRWFLESEFPKFYDFIEYICGLDINSDNKYRDEYNHRRTYEEWMNRIFEEEKVCFRFVNHKLVKIIDAHEIDEVESATQNEAPFSAHISAALVLYSKRPDPDFRNAVKEAISAVESASKSYYGDRSVDLAKVLAKLEVQLGLHSQVLAAFKNLYAWTSAADGIRHSIMDKSSLTEHETRFMIIACSAFCNLLISAQSRE